MTLVDVEQRVLELQEMIQEEIDLLLPSLNNGIKKIKGDVSKHCFKCEYIWGCENAGMMSAFMVTLKSNIM